MLTLKLAHCNWSGAPYRWRYENHECGYSGDAYFIDATRSQVEGREGGVFMGDKLYELDSNNENVFVGYRGDNRRVGYQTNVPADVEYVGIWKMCGVKGLPADFDNMDVKFEGLPAETIEAWIGGVRQVTALGEIAPDKVREVHLDPRYAHMTDMEIWTWMGTDKKTARKVIMVSLDNGDTRTMLVERAWLLGPNGDTIQKIAP